LLPIDRIPYFSIGDRDAGSLFSLVCLELTLQYHRGVEKRQRQTVKLKHPHPGLLASVLLFCLSRRESSSGGSHLVPGWKYSKHSKYAGHTHKKEVVAAARC
jgi:hypothetical protein